MVYDQLLTSIHLKLFVVVFFRPFVCCPNSQITPKRLCLNICQSYFSKNIIWNKRCLILLFAKSMMSQKYEFKPIYCSQNVIQTARCLSTNTTLLLFLFSFSEDPLRCILLYKHPIFSEAFCSLDLIFTCFLFNIKRLLTPKPETVQASHSRVFATHKQNEW